MVVELLYPTLEAILIRLRIPEIKAFAEAHPENYERCEVEIRRILGSEFRRKKMFKWNRCAPDEDDDVMADRHSHSLVYYPQNRSVYCFGGEVVIDRAMESSVGGPPAFNDLWRFDMAKLRWSRVNVTNPPYPGAKFGASFVVWRDEIVLYGGLGSADYRNVSIRLMTCNQIHIFNPQTERWRIMATEVEGPDLISHTACIKDDLMFVFGGRRQDPLAHQKLYILDLKLEQWRVVDLFPQIRIVENRIDRRSRFPILDLRKSQIIWIKDGCLLVTGEMVMDYGLSFIVTYDPETLTGWNWKEIPTEGRWWKPRMVDNLGVMIRDASCADPNFKFDPIAVIRNEPNNMLRLVSLGRSKGDDILFRNVNNVGLKYDVVQNRGKMFTIHLQEIINKELDKRVENQEQEFGTDLSGEFEGISYRIENCFLEQSICRAVLKNKETPVTVKRCKVFLKCDNVVKWDNMMLDDVDFMDIKRRIKTMVINSQNRHYKATIHKPVPAIEPVRYRMVPKLSIYTAEIDLSQEIEKIVWTSQPLQYGAAPETLNYKMVAAENEVVIHGGYVDLRGQERQMGHTYLLIPTANARKPIEAAPLSRNYTWPLADKPSTSR